MTTRNRIEFDDSEFRLSHARAPRGYGSWAFEIANGTLPPIPVFFHSAYYRDARRACVVSVRDALAAFGVSGAVVRLTVCP